MPAGRPTKKTPETIAMLEEALYEGLSHRKACDYAGIDYSTFKAWLHEDGEMSARLKRRVALSELEVARDVRLGETKGPGQIFWLKCRGWSESGSQHDRDDEKPQTRFTVALKGQPAESAEPTGTTTDTTAPDAPAPEAVP